MWTCYDMKKAGWSKLSSALWTAVLVTLIFVAVSGLFTGGQNVINVIKYRIQFNGDFRSYFSDVYSGKMNSSPSVTVLNSLQGLLGLLSIVSIFFLINPLGVGYARWFLTNRKKENPAGVSLLLSPFQQGCYLGVVSGTAWKYLWTYIWTLVAGLCFLPFYGVVFAGLFSIVISAGSYSGSTVSMGRDEIFNRLWDSFLNVAPTFAIIAVITLLLGLAGYIVITLNRKYAYFFTDFILAQNPTIGAKNALNLSKRMTYGIKAKLFVLDLSFIGWWLLSFLTCGILSLGVLPYTYATYTEVYLDRKAELHI